MITILSSSSSSSSPQWLWQRKSTWSSAEQKVESDIRTCKSNCWTCLRRTLPPDHHHHHVNYAADDDDGYPADNHDAGEDDGYPADDCVANMLMLLLMMLRTNLWFTLAPALHMFLKNKLSKSFPRLLARQEGFHLIHHCLMMLMWSRRRWKDNFFSSFFSEKESRKLDFSDNDNNNNDKQL